ncbi:hypothetical protein Taro_023698 [Colocasia esculenta]|uniref:Uncharacterized protein n=1 Tax=Colocasia esculenta TaxID=4460 RepID=A0A843UY49_COLES|nr:hypothetical protein [Colocasia esculenta]
MGRIFSHLFSIFKVADFQYKQLTNEHSFFMFSMKIWCMEDDRAPSLGGAAMGGVCWRHQLLVLLLSLLLEQHLLVLPLSLLLEQQVRVSLHLPILEYQLLVLPLSLLLEQQVRVSLHLPILEYQFFSVALWERARDAIPALGIMSVLADVIKLTASVRSDAIQHLTGQRWDKLGPPTKQSRKLYSTGERLAAEISGNVDLEACVLMWFSRVEAARSVENTD